MSFVTPDIHCILLSEVGHSDDSFCNITYLYFDRFPDNP
jgi:hypothetical protein